MAGIAHAFVNPKSDGGDTDQTQPSDWNAAHVVATVDAALGGDVTMVNTATYYDGPSDSFADGTWIIWWKAVIQVIVATSQSYQFTARLWDGTTIYDESQNDPDAAAGSHNGFQYLISGHCVVTLTGGPTTLKISVAGIRSSSSAKIARNVISNTGTSNKATRITALQVA